MSFWPCSLLAWSFWMIRQEKSWNSVQESFCTSVCVEGKSFCKGKEVSINSRTAEPESLWSVYEKKVVACCSSSKLTGKTGEWGDPNVGKKMALPVLIGRFENHISKDLCVIRTFLPSTNHVQVLLPSDDNLLCNSTSLIYLSWAGMVLWELWLKCKWALNVSLEFTLLGGTDTILENTLMKFLWRAGSVTCTE